MSNQGPAKRRIAPTVNHDLGPRTWKQDLSAPSFTADWGDNRALPVDRYLEDNIPYQAQKRKALK